MALVFQKYRLTITFIDTAGEKVKRTVRLTAATDAVAMSDALGIVSAFVNVSDAKVSSYEVTKIFAESALALPVAADNKEVCVVNAPIAGRPNKRGWYSFPAPKDTMFYGLTGADANIAKMNQANMVTLLKVFVSIANGGWGTGMISDGETITMQDAAGERQHRKG